VTTIAYRDGVLASDSRAYSGDKTPIGAKTKIHRLDDGRLIGISTTNVGGDALIRRWAEAGCPIQDASDLKPDAFEALLLKPDGSVWYANGNLDWTGPLTGSFIAIGSGSQFALGAMAAGASAEDAVRLSCGLDPWSAEPVMTLRLKPGEPDGADR
jgi:20S proteasome alpha/beta subunit